MQIHSKLLAIIGKRIPAIYDVIPRGPLRGAFQLAARSQLEQEVELNPQPLPPLELGAAVADEFIRNVAFAGRYKLDAGIAFEDLDDWCPTRPKKLKLPPWWRIPFPPPPEPDPRWFVEFHAGFATRLAVVLSDFEGSAVSDPLNKAIDRSIGAIESVKG